MTYGFILLKLSGVVVYRAHLKAYRISHMAYLMGITANHLMVCCKYIAVVLWVLAAVLLQSFHAL